MVDTESPTALAALVNPTASHRHRRNHENGLTKLPHGSTVGWISRNTLDLRSEEKFFLDIPFYRPSRNTLDLRSKEKFFLDIPFYRTHGHQKRQNNSCNVS
jgi:hypothetical protein